MSNKITLEDMRKSAKRELDYRKYVYMKLAAQGKMEQNKADHEIACMQAILDNLYKQKDDGELL
jgi:hypothetical protein